jgi:hypothetical protein
VRTPIIVEMSSLPWMLHFALGLAGFAAALAAIRALSHHWLLREGGHHMSAEDFVPDEQPTRLWTAGQTISLELTDVNLKWVSIATGIPLVDLSIDYEPWLVRGED